MEPRAGSLRIESLCLNCNVPAEAWILLYSDAFTFLIEAQGFEQKRPCSSA
jgi:hypothetical protein